MAQGLQNDIQQKRPFRSIYEEAGLNIFRSASLLDDEGSRLLKAAAVTGPQYNVLRILKGSESTGLCRNDVRDRMLTRMPDMTRLLDRMEEAGLVKRERSESDRRHVTTHITAAGKRLLKDLEGPIARLQEKQFGHMSEKELRQLIELLTKARSK
ncbi:MAG: winged helix-turn-helix transcriptional regulator [Gemmatimonadaceae bacterium]|nr:winged helix-turn-helix transcriptional regulator [Gemmatimonadaceae bacterium]